jgi:hypothetical protein
LGRLVSSTALLSGNNLLSNPILESGVYLYEIKDTNGTKLSRGKILKQ